MKHFKLDEFRCKCCGELPSFAKENIEALVNKVLDGARARLGKPVTVNSGYRCAKHNREVGGAANSQHCCSLGSAAADITAGSREENLKLAAAIVKGGDWDQMILYVGKNDLLPKWVHVSWKRNGANRREVRKHVVGTGPIYPKLTAEEMAVLKSN